MEIKSAFINTLPKKGQSWDCDFIPNITLSKLDKDEDGLEKDLYLLMIGWLFWNFSIGFE